MFRNLSKDYQLQVLKFFKFKQDNDGMTSNVDLGSQALEEFLLYVQEHDIPHWSQKDRMKLLKFLKTNTGENYLKKLVNKLIYIQALST